MISLNNKKCETLYYKMLLRTMIQVATTQIPRSSVIKAVNTQGWIGNYSPGHPSTSSMQHESHRNLQSRYRVDLKKSVDLSTHYRMTHSRILFVLNMQKMMWGLLWYELRRPRIQKSKTFGKSKVRANFIYIIF